MEDRKIRVGIPHGDTNGVGYELIFRTFATPEMLELCTPIIYGSPKVAAYHRKALDLQANFSIIAEAQEAKDGRVNLLTCFDDDVKVDLGTPTPESGNAAMKALDRAMADFRAGAFDVLVSCPVCAGSTDDSGFQFGGLSHYVETCLGDGKKALEVLLSENLRIAVLTDGLPIKDVAKAVTEERLTQVVAQLTESLKRDFRLSCPRTAVLALNPTGDGSEEQNVIKPAIEKMPEAGKTVFGPYRADSFFSSNYGEAFDCVLAMYDDQANIPFHALSQDFTVAYIAGMSLVCTAPVVENPFNTGAVSEADESSFRHAIYTAIDIFRHRETYDEPLANPLQKLYHEKRDDSDKARFATGKRHDQRPRPQSHDKEEAKE